MRSTRPCCVGAPVRSTMLPYARQTIDEDDRNAVNDVLKGDWLTTGPAIAAFETELCDSTGAHHAAAMSSPHSRPPCGDIRDRDRARR